MSTTSTIERWNVTNDAYHADHSAIGSSMLMTFRKSPALYHQRFVSNEILPPEPTPDMVLGSALHCLTLEIGVFAERYATAIKVDGRTKEGKALKAEFAAKNAGKIILDSEDYAKTLDWNHALMTHPVAAKLLNSYGVNEVAFRWTDDETGLTLKARFDRLIVPPVVAQPVVVDLKTAIDPSPAGFAKAVANFDYHLQAALYCEAAHLLTDEEPVFLFVCVGKDAPHDVWVHQLDSEFAALGARELRTTLRKLAVAYSMGDWRAEGQDEITTLSAPRWAMSL